MKHHSSPNILKTRALTLIVCAATVFATSLHAQDMHQRVEFDTFFEDEPVLLLGVSGGLGFVYDDPAVYPLISLNLGNVSPNHLYLGGRLQFRPTEPFHFKASIRLGVMFQGVDFAWGIGVSPGVLSFPSQREWGGILSWSVGGRMRLDGLHFLTLDVEADLLFEVLGFSDTNTLLSIGLGWAVMF